MKLVRTFSCQDDKGTVYEAHEYAEVIDAKHMQGSGLTYGMREYRLANGAGLRPLGGNKFHCQSLMTEMRQIEDL